jgi:hypothetical protein
MELYVLRGQDNLLPTPVICPDNAMHVQSQLKVFWKLYQQLHTRVMIPVCSVLHTYLRENTQSVMRCSSNSCVQI